MNKTYLLLGSNVGNRMQHLTTARNLIERHMGKVISASLVYETAAWGNPDQHDFLNQVLFVETVLTAAACMNEILTIESSMGRVRRKKNDPRIIDIDILFYNDDIIYDALLSIPHPQLQNRKFVLIPMNELSPGLQHPVLKKSIAYLLSTCMDDLEVRVFGK